MFFWIFLCNLCFASNIVTLNKGDRAPFNGTLLSPEAAAKLLAKQESSVSTCLANKKKEINLLKAENKLNLKSKEAELAACTLRYTKHAEVYEKQIKYLEKRAAPPNWQTTAIFAGGVLSGIGVMVVSAWSLNQLK